LLVGHSRCGCIEEGAEGTIFTGCDSGVSAEVADDAGGLSARAAAESAVFAAAGLSESGDDESVGGGDFGGEERRAVKTKIQPPRNAERRKERRDLRASLRVSRRTRRFCFFLRGAFRPSIAGSTTKSAH